MSRNKKRKYENCTFCENRVIYSRRANAINKLGDSEVLERIKNFNGGNIDEGRISTFIMCNICRDEVDAAYKCVTKCQILVTGQSLVSSKRLKNAMTQTELSQPTIIIVNQLSKEVKQKELEEIFSEYGKIAKIYARMERIFSNVENFAQITFSNEDDAFKVMKAAAEKKLCYNGTPLVVTRVLKDHSPIDILPDVCLTEIFLRIDEVKDKMNIGQVCERWKEALGRSWSNVINFSNFGESEEGRTVGGMKSLFKKCGRFLENLRMAIYDRPISHMKLIRKYCKNIENLHLGMNCKARSAKYKHEVLSVFQQCSKLHRICIQRLDEHFDYDHLAHLPKEMLEIHLFSNHLVRPSVDLSKFKNLEALALSNFDFEEDTLNGIENLSNLKFLSFERSTVHPSNIRKILNFEKLEHLAIPECEIDDEILSQIVHKNLDLQYLDISDNPNITDRSFEYVGRLSKLRTLYMMNLPGVIASNLSEMINLKDLDVEGCMSVTDWTLMMLIDKSEKLSTLYAAGPSTWRLLMNAHDSIKSRCSTHCFFIHTDVYLARRWPRPKEFDFKFLVSDTSRSEMVLDDDDWSGWRGNVRRLY